MPVISAVQSYFFALTFSRTVLRSATTKGKKIRLRIKPYKRKKPVTPCIEATGYSLVSGGFEYRSNPL